MVYGNVILLFPLFPLMDFAGHFLPSLSCDFSPIKKKAGDKVVEVFGEILKKGLRLWGSHISHISELNPVI
jgi:hypothetical protein